MRPTIGCIVAYKLTETDAWAVNSRRADGARHADTRIADGAQVHVGPDVSAGDVLPLIITRVEHIGVDELDEEVADLVKSSVKAEGAPVDGLRVEVINGKVLLDGNDTLWVTGRFQCDHESDGMPHPGCWGPVLSPRREGWSPATLDAYSIDDAKPAEDGQV